MDANAVRIEQFRKMALADPDNELGHFSLGRAFLDAGDWAGAIAAFNQVIRLNPNIGKVYQLLAQAQLKLNKQEQAIATLKTGVQIAHNRGDMLPKNDMIQMLRDLGQDAPDLTRAQTSQTVGEGQVQCVRCGLVKARLAEPPFRNAQGREIQEKICVDCWREWVAMGTKVINELRLPLADPQAQKIFDEHMIEFLNLK